MNRTTADQRERMARMFDLGATTAETARRCRCSYRTTQRYRRQAEAGKAWWEWKWPRQQKQVTDDGTMPRVDPIPTPTLRSLIEVMRARARSRPFGPREAR